MQVNLGVWGFETFFYKKTIWEIAIWEKSEQLDLVIAINSGLQKY